MIQLDVRPVTDPLGFAVLMFSHSDQYHGTGDGVRTVPLATNQLDFVRERGRGHALGHRTSSNTIPNPVTIPPIPKSVGNISQDTVHRIPICCLEIPEVAQDIGPMQQRELICYGYRIPFKTGAFIPKEDNDCSREAAKKCV
jgi:hypothetical protein